MTAHAELQQENRLGLKTRLKELGIDYLVIVTYLAGLLGVAMAFYQLALGGIPEMTALQAQLIAAVTTVVPAMLGFALLEYRPPFGTYGKRKAGLRVAYRTRVFWRSLVRNIVKFAPWQLAHMGVIEGAYSEFESPMAMVLISVALALAAVLLMMALFRKDKRHLGDILAGTQVVTTDD